MYVGPEKLVSKLSKFCTTPQKGCFSNEMIRIITLIDCICLPLYCLNIGSSTTIYHVNLTFHSKLQRISSRQRKIMLSNSKTYIYASIIAFMYDALEFWFSFDLSRKSFVFCTYFASVCYPVVLYGNCIACMKWCRNICYLFIFSIDSLLLRLQHVEIYFVGDENDIWSLSFILKSILFLSCIKEICEILFDSRSRITVLLHKECTWTEWA